MSQSDLYMISGVAVFAVCLYALIVHAHLIRKILALNMMGTGVFLVLTGIARRGPGVDPVPQALVLTGIVVTVAATAFALALTRRVHLESGGAYLTEDLQEENAERGLDERGSG